MATPRSITVVHAGLSGVFDETFPQIPSSGTCNHQGMPRKPRISTRRQDYSAGKDISAGRTGDEEDHKRHGRLQETGHATGTAIGTATPSARMFL